jgi:solute carrier family 25 folate transporter 32
VERAGQDGWLGSVGSPTRGGGSTRARRIVGASMTATTSTGSGVKSTAEHSFLRSLISGAGAGVICTILCAPLDVTKVRLQVQGTLGRKGKYPDGIYASIRKIYLEEGLRGVFKGVGPALITVPMFWGVYWPIYDALKTRFRDEELGLSPSTGHILSAVMAGAVGDVITNPFWVTRTRIQTLAMHPESKLSPEVSTVQMMKYIHQTEGWRAFYKGLGASFLGLSHVAIQFPLCKYFAVLACVPLT